MKVIVYHTYYGCDTGCCGHAIKIDGEEVFETFDFTHPWSEKTDLELRQWAYEFARTEINKMYGPEHAFDLDWENCEIIDD